MSKESAREATKKHIENVNSKIQIVREELNKRGLLHDKSKLEEPEVTTFDVYTDKLKGCTYGSDEYKEYLRLMKPALDHHYANNRHHPECHANGLEDMNLVDIFELFCDWLSATERHDDGNIYKSIEMNQERFNMSDQLCNIFRNTAKDIFNKEK